MNKTTIIIVVCIIISCISFIAFLQYPREETNEKKAETCPTGVAKYYGENGDGECGEFCGNSINALIAKVIIRKEVFLAEDKSCKNLGYTEYVKTKSYGKLYVDLYNKP